MEDPTRIYLDTCFLNRPFDDQSDARIRLETEALKLVFARIRAGLWILVGSQVLELEVSRTPNVARREILQEILVREVLEHVEVDDKVSNLARAIQDRGINGFDAVHLACAAKASVDAFLTTDDRLVRQAHRVRDLLPIPVHLPLQWPALTAYREGNDQ